eukprot:CAMPEP_0115037492 /NCGR_PEP_ID=MMETSP0216-20121206/42833_1 /TAXON_ID=223996 /ORGANISM="Protocruzia adherens, Strain Boccale" /LENGTH=44 /DNA_ID= /DNA_START= /DNA_END= /DNA_ORIENTATION=
MIDEDDSDGMAGVADMYSRLKRNPVENPRESTGLPWIDGDEVPV